MIIHSRDLFCEISGDLSCVRNLFSFPHEDCMTVNWNITTTQSSRLCFCRWKETENIAFITWWWIKALKTGNISRDCSNVLQKLILFFFSCCHCLVVVQIQALLWTKYFKLLIKYTQSSDLFAACSSLNKCIFQYVWSKTKNVFMLYFIWLFNTV